MDITDMKQARATVIEFGGRLIKAGEEERARIARELHDDINQRLALLANGLQEVEQAAADQDDQLKQPLRVLGQLTSEIATDIQRMSHHLHPSKLHYLGLRAAVRELCLEFSKQHKIEVECIVNRLPLDLDETTSLNLFRTVQESLHNVAKHSHAHHVKVEVSCDSDLVRLRVSDDGVGFASERAPNLAGLGLVSMQERLRSLGGELSIWSKPSLGTLVEGTVPVKFKAESSELTVGEPSERK
jgi:signal transduction histidine kinase